MHSIRTKLFLVLSLLVTVTFLRLALTTEKKVDAASSQCPSGYTQQQCYDYLINLKNNLTNQRRQLDASIKNLQKQEGSIQSQVNAINAQIQATENDLALREVDIELLSIEIANVGADIADTKNRIDTLTQEKNSSIQKINEVAMMTYKLKSIPTWYVLAQNDLISTLEMIKYYDYLANQEQTRLATYANLQHQLDSEESVLAKSQADIIDKRNTLEAENQEIVKLKQQLTAQKAEQTKLLADLKAEEARLAEERRRLQNQENAAARESLAIAMQLFSSGKLGAGTPVKKGGIVGFQGHTGCAYGSHLHFGIIQSSNKSQYYANVNPITSGYLTTSGGSVYSGKGQVFYSGALVTQWYHDGYYLDTVSTAEGDQTGNKYFISKGSLKCNTAYSGWHYLRGEGAPVRALLDGVVHRGTIDRYGGNFVVVDHGNNLRTAYYHLR